MDVQRKPIDQMEVKDFLPTWELLAQLAEECCELGQAALKLRRVLDDVNPTRATFNEALASFLEEWADVRLVMMQLNIVDEGVVYANMQYKYNRWVTHLREHYKEDQDGKAE